METASGTIYHYFDDSLNALLSLLERTLPNTTCCNNEEYIAWETHSYQAHCEYALRDMTERARRLVKHRQKETAMLSTGMFSFGNHSTICGRLDAQCHRLTDTGRELVEQLKTELLRLLNHGLTADEEAAKWDRLRRKTQFSAVQISTGYTKIHEYYDDTNPNEQELCHYILTHDYPEAEVMCFMQLYLGKVKEGGYKMVKVATPTEPAQPKKMPSKAKKTSGAQIVSDNFCYRWIETDPERITSLYQGLLKAEWIDEKTGPDDFFHLFEGKPRDINIRWTGSQQNLWYLFKLLTDRKYVTLPQGRTRWVVVGSHFLNSDSRRFGDWNKQKVPTISKLSVETLAELLNPAHTELKMSDTWDAGE